MIKPDDAALAQMNDFVRDMHTGPACWRSFRTARPWPKRQAVVRDYFKKWIRIPGRPRWVATRWEPTGVPVRDMPEVVEHLHYRVIDVSTIKELSRRWFARAYFQSPAKLGGHRALGNIKDSIDELRYYREAVFVPVPGPDSATAQRIAKRVMGDSASGVGRQVPPRSLTPRPQPEVICATFCGNFGENPKSGKSVPKQQVSYLSLPFRTAG